MAHGSESESEQIEGLIERRAGGEPDHERTSGQIIRIVQTQSVNGVAIRCRRVLVTLNQLSCNKKALVEQHERGKDADECEMIVHE